MAKIFPLAALTDARSSKNILQVNNEIGKDLGLQQGDKVLLFAGKLFNEVKINIKSEISSRNIKISPVILNKLHLPDSGQYGISSANRELHIGPIIGIMAGTSQSENRLYGSQNKFFIELITYARTIGAICFVFEYKNINFRSKTILGYIWVKGMWKKRLFPIPDVVYIRGSRGCSPPIMQTRRKLESLGCKFINPAFIGNKWQMHKVLLQNSSLNQYLPDTKLISNFQQVGQMLEDYGVVYLKPISGSKGKNIIKVVKNYKTYEYFYQINYKPFQGKANNLGNLNQSLKRIMEKRSYIVQRGIKLLKVNGNIADIRVLVQKDHTGQFSITGKAFRIGNKGSITSNISGGGSGQKLYTVLNRYFPDYNVMEEIINKIDYLSLKAAQVLETKTSAIGELGIDIGVDINGKVWFIEANAKPARRVFNLISDNSAREMSIKKPLLYARYLAGFVRKG